MSEQGSDSRANQIMNYSFLVAFANDGTLDKSEVEFMERLALKDGVIDDDEKQVFRSIFGRVSRGTVSEDTWEEICKFRIKYGI